MKSTTKEFIEKARQVHGDKYDYSKVDYKDSYIKIIIVCSKHGEFLQRPGNHINLKNGCPHCRGNIVTKEEFVDKSKQIHGDKYDYGLFNFINTTTKGKIICKKHGEFLQMPNNHVRGNGCLKCAREIRSGNLTKTTDYFVKNAKKIHGNRYDYSKVDYVGNRSKVIIICKEHGEFLQGVSCHIKGHGCPECVGLKKITTEYFISRAKQIHGDKYDYGKVNCKGSLTKVIITCKKHGDFLQTPSGHLGNGGCFKCGVESGNLKQKNTLKQFVDKSNETHGNKYDYSKVDYINNYTKIIIICPEHGEFLQKPTMHMRGSGCPECVGVKKPTTEQFILKAIKIHGNKYNYGRSIYTNNYTKVAIVCPKHGEFLKTPSDHICHDSGCPHCKASKGESLIAKILDEYHIHYIKQKTFFGCKNIKMLRYDFYLPDYKILIEFNGIQHYEYIDYWNKGRYTFLQQQHRDEIKQQYAIINGYEYIVIKYTDNINDILKNRFKITQEY